MNKFERTTLVVGTAVTVVVANAALSSSTSHGPGTENLASIQSQNKVAAIHPKVDTYSLLAAAVFKIYKNPNGTIVQGFGGDTSKPPSELTVEVDSHDGSNIIVGVETEVVGDQISPQQLSFSRRTKSNGFYNSYSIDMSKLPDGNWSDSCVDTSGATVIVNGEFYDLDSTQKMTHDVGKSSMLARAMFNYATSSISSLSEAAKSGTIDSVVPANFCANIDKNMTK